jgi:hypothetical protein
MVESSHAVSVGWQLSSSAVGPPNNRKPRCRPRCRGAGTTTGFRRLVRSRWGGAVRQRTVFVGPYGVRRGHVLCADQHYMLIAQPDRDQHRRVLQSLRSVYPACGSPGTRQTPRTRASERRRRRRTLGPGEVVAGVEPAALLQRVPVLVEVDLSSATVLGSVLQRDLAGRVGGAGQLGHFGGNRGKTDPRRAAYGVTLG